MNYFSIENAISDMEFPDNPVSLHPIWWCKVVLLNKIKTQQYFHKWLTENDWGDNGTGIYGYLTPKDIRNAYTGELIDVKAVMKLRWEEVCLEAHNRSTINS